MRAVLTSDWDWDRLSRYTRDITTAFQKLQARFPRDIDIDHLAEEVMNGTRQMWLALDDDDKFVAVMLTQIDTNRLGAKTLLMPAFAGDASLSLLPLIPEVEKWAKEQGCDETWIYGRDGWGRKVPEYGYEKDMTVYRKRL